LNFCSCDQEFIQNTVDEISDEITTETQKLEGTWITRYELQGPITIIIEDQSTNIDCTNVIESYDMTAIGQGYWCCFFFNGTEEPVLMMGGPEMGVFTFLAASGNGTICLYKQTTLKENCWNFTYDGKSIVAEDANAMKNSFSKANQE